mmetsp:Transcript_18516/g.37417  ORF Transcript_18516/g.37417 Transcript_18516/m.37417 type:complete len:99 (-) Transcript_18516:60-356(-)
MPQNTTRPQANILDWTKRTKRKNDKNNENYKNWRKIRDNHISRRYHLSSPWLIAVFTRMYSCGSYVGYQKKHGRLETKQHISAHACAPSTSPPLPMSE